MLSSNDIKFFASLKQKKYRQEHNRFLIEGFHLVEECLSSPFILEYILLRNDMDLSSHPKILEKISQNKTIVEALPEKSFNKLIETESSQGIIGVVAKPKAKTTTEAGKVIVALDKINDPGNLGTIIRTAYWFNAGAILLSENSADVYNSKVLRSSQGAVFYSNIHEDVSLPDKLAELKAQGYTIYLFTLDAEMNLDEIEGSVKKDKSVIVLGSEAHGISEELLSNEYIKVKIRGYSSCESLNVGISAGIALYEFSLI
jgi:RNA methyltransferase, TrmH family